MTHRCFASLILTALAAAACSTPGASERIQLERVPNEGIQPQAVTDAEGVVHVVYFKGDAAAGDIYYVRRARDGTYSTPLRVNSQTGSAIAIGSVRGAQLALGRADRIHVVWNGSDPAQPRPGEGMPLLYTRLNDAGDAFDPQRNLATWVPGPDGGATVAADAGGRVFVAWHANPDRSSDAHRAVYLTRSDDDGGRFSREERVSPEALGACTCCSMRALVDRSGALLLLFRAAAADVDRDMTLLRSGDGGRTFSVARVDPWKLEACPLSSASLADGPRGVTAAWETRGQILFADLSSTGAAAPSPQSAPRTGLRKHPVMSYNAAGELLLAWLEDTAWARGGAVAWQLYDREGRATAEQGSVQGVPAWGLAAVAPLPDGRFLVLY